MTARAALVAAWTAVIVHVAPPTVAAQTCLGAPARVAVDEPVDITLTEDGVARLRGSKIAFVHVTYVRTRDSPPTTVTEAASIRQLLPGSDGMPKTTFRFGRDGLYTLRTHAADQEAWPHRADTGKAIEECSVQQVVAKTVRRAEFADVHTESWLALRLPYHPELGAAVYFGRLGLAASVATTRSSTADSKWIGRAEIRRRGSRGYLGAGIAYEPRPAEGRLRIKPLVVLGEELPSFKGRPTWLILDVRLDDFNANFFKDLRVSAGARLDLTRNGRPR